MKRLSVIVVCMLLLAGCTTTQSAISRGELVDCSSLTVEKVNAFRKLCFEKHISVTVIKNTLLKKAIEKATHDPLYFSETQTL